MGSIASQYTTSIIGTFFRDFSGVIGNSFQTATEHFSLAKAERELRLLDDRMLSDIGITRGDITYAVRKGKCR